MPKLDIKEITTRWNLSWKAHQLEINKYTLIDRWMKAYEKHIYKGEVWGEAYRFPELYGAVIRKYQNIIEYLPSMKVSNGGDEAIALQAAYDHQLRVSNIDREEQRAVMDAVKGGLGCVYVAPTRWEKKINLDSKKNEAILYDGLAAERVDPRDIIPAYSALVLHDHTGQQYCPYLFRRKVYYRNSFFEKYGKNSMFKIPKDLQGVSYSGGFSGDRQLTEREGTEKESGEYITILEYWDVDNDLFQVYANSFNNLIYESPNGIPFAHKQLPFHFYYNYTRHDSIYGTGEVELNMPYNLFRESVLNLMIDNAKLELQPAYVIGGEVNFNTEEAELQPGAIFTLRGQNVGKVQDSIMPFRSGGIGGGSFQVLQEIENSRIVVTGDDTTSLYANPQQLATQTLAKREAVQKRAREFTLRSACDTKFYLANQVVSYLTHELSAPYKGRDGVTTYRKIRINGFHALQDKKDSAAEFVKEYGKEGEFFLNKKVAEKFKDIEIEIITDKYDLEIKRDTTEKMMQFMNQIMTTAQVSPQLLQGLDFTEFLKETAKNLDMDIKKLFPPLDKDTQMIDIIDQEHDQVAMGIVPEIKPDEDSSIHYMKHLEFEKSAIFKKLGKKAHKALKDHKLLTLQNVWNQKSNPTQDQKGGMAGPPQISQQQPVQGMGGEPQAVPQEGGGVFPPQAIEGQLPQGAA